MFAQRHNAFRPSFLRMIADILRFNRECKKVLAGTDDKLTLGEYLEQHRYSRAFRDNYIVPMGMSVWSSTDSTALVTNRQPVSRKTGSSARCWSRCSTLIVTS